MNPLEFYSARAEKLGYEIYRLSRQLGILSVARLISFLAGVVSFFLLYGNGLLQAVIVSMLLFALFGLFFSISEKKSREKEFKNHVKDYCEREILVVKETDIYAGDGGVEFVDMHHSFTYDLDVFGEKSLFSFLNRTVTNSGRNTLAGWISHPVIDTETLKDRQEAVSELAGKTEFRLSFHATGKMYNEEKNDSQMIGEWLQERSFLKKYHYALMYGIPGLTIIAAIAAFGGLIPWSFLWLPVMLAFFVVMLNMKKVNSVHVALSRRTEILKKYEKLILLIENESFSSPLLAKLRKSFGGEKEGSVSGEIKKLAGILKGFDFRLNMIMGAVLNGLFIWDLHCIAKLEKWKNENGSKFPEWISSLAAFDGIQSPANIRFNFQEFVMPGFSKDSMHFQGIAFAHPLIPSAARVANTLEIEKNGFFTIITGANMAGKSTLLRSAGVNMLLAYCGAPVCAREFVFSPSVLFTSMRTADSLYKNESYFYAELKRLKALVDILESGNNAFILLDEILKGTNSIDKQKGSAEVLKRLIELGGTGIIATHDLSLAGLEKQMPGNIENRCFEINLQDGEMQFDYKLREGIARTMNAGILLKQLGIVK